MTKNFPKNKPNFQKNVKNYKNLSEMTQNWSKLFLKNVPFYADDVLQFLSSKSKISSNLLKFSHSFDVKNKWNYVQNVFQND